MNNLWVYDIEQYPNFHSCYLINVNTGEHKKFVLWFNNDDENHTIDDREAYYNFLMTLRFDPYAGMIGYNNIAYDYTLIHEFIKLNGYLSYETVHYAIRQLNAKSNSIINEERKFGIQERFHYIPQLDLFKIHHFDNVARSTSLKKLEGNMRWHNLEDLPIEPGSIIEFDDVNRIMMYNANDVLVTKELYWITKGDENKITVDFPGLKEFYIGKDRIELRKETKKQYGINCMNYSDVKIGEEINKQVYLSQSGKSWDDIKNGKTFRGDIHLKDLIPSYISYKSEPLKKLLKELENTTINAEDPSFKYEFLFAENIWTFGLGGIHTKDKGRIVTPANDEFFEEQDVGSMYPNKIDKGIHPVFGTQGLYPEHLGIEWLQGYRFNKERRLKLKPQAKKDPSIKLIIDVLKLALNGGGYGKTGDVWNWQYDPLVKYATTIACQLDIMLLADMLVLEIPGLKIESGNTDGINIIYKKKYEPDVIKICKQWDEITDAQLERTRYKKVIRTTVNDYMAIKEDGSVKRKGDFEIEKELHKDMSMHIVKVAVDEYYRNGIPVRKTIESCKNIYDFCKMTRVQNTNTGRWKAVYHTIEDNRRVVYPLSKNIRYYVDNSGKGKLYKECYFGKSKGKLTSIEAKNSVVIFNKFEDKPFEEYNVNINYYVSEAMKIINGVHDGQLSLF